MMSDSIYLMQMNVCAAAYAYYDDPGRSVRLSIFEQKHVDIFRDCLVLRNSLP